MTRDCLFVLPDPTATITGGNLYNLGLTAALRDAGVPLTIVQLAGAEAALRAGAAGVCFVDSLYLDDLPRLRQTTRVPAYLLLHYLPSLVAHGAIPRAAELSAAERAALAVADGFVVPSAFMARAVAALAPAGRPLIVVEPALEVAAMAPPAALERARLEAVLVANLVPGKGVLPLLDALVPHLRAGAPLALTVIGSDESDPAYAAACRRRLAEEPLLAGSVRLAGALAHPATLAGVAACDLLVSASRMESYGLALAEARALGVPIVARDAGNAAAHVDEAAGGRLLATDEALAAECALLARDRGELTRRRRAAQAARRPPRAWSDAARDFAAALTDVRERASE